MFAFSRTYWYSGLYLIECKEEMVANMLNKFEISPSLREIVNHFDDDNKRPPNTFSFETKQAEEIDEPYDNGAEFNADTFGNGGTWDDDLEDQTNVADDGTFGGDPVISSQHEVLGFLSFSSDLVHIF